MRSFFISIVDKKSGEDSKIYWKIFIGEINILIIFIYKEEFKKLCLNLYINEIMEFVVRGKELLYRI